MNFAQHYETHAIVQQEIGNRLFERFDFFKINPQSILELACATGDFTEKMAARYPEASIIALDSSSELIEKARQRAVKNVTWQCEDIFNARFKSGQFDCIVFNLFPILPEQASELFERIHAWLAPGGLMVFSTLGQDTFKELRAVFAQVKQAFHFPLYLDLHPIGDLLLSMGFSDPVMNGEWLTLTYDDLQKLQADVQTFGDFHLPADMNVFAQAYDAWKQAGRYPVTYEIIYGMAYKAQTVKAVEGEAGFPIDWLTRRK